MARQDIRALDPNLATKSAGSDVVWFDLQRLTIEGRGWSDTQTPYDRLPSRAQKVVRPALWDLSLHSAGIAARFVTDAPALSARWSLRFESLAMDNMPATGVSGIDLYARCGNRWNWVGMGTPTKYPENETTLVVGVPAEMREYLAYLPLYNGVSRVEIGIPQGCTIAPAPPRTSRPICFYGTSVVQGASASRPGMVHTAIVSRRLDRPHLNLGFSGNGKMDAELADLLGELDPCVYVIDCLPNMGPAMTTERMAAFIRTLRRARPTTPIVMIENIIIQNAHLVESMRGTQQTNAAFHKEFAALVAAGVPNLHFVPCDTLLGDDFEATVDSVHPTDLGFMRFADVLTPILREMIESI